MWGDICAMYSCELDIAEWKIGIKQQITFVCDCQCVVHLTQLSVSSLMRQQEVLFSEGNYSIATTHSAEPRLGSRNPCMTVLFGKPFMTVLFEKPFMTVLFGNPFMTDLFGNPFVTVLCGNPFMTNDV